MRSARRDGDAARLDLFAFGQRQDQQAVAVGRLDPRRVHAVGQVEGRAVAHLGELRENQDMVLEALDRVFGDDGEAMSSADLLSDSQKRSLAQKGVLSDGKTDPRAVLKAWMEHEPLDPALAAPSDVRFLPSRRSPELRK